MLLQLPAGVIVRFKPALNPAFLVVDGLFVLPALGAASDHLLKSCAFNDRMGALRVHVAVLLVEDLKLVVLVIVGKAVRHSIDGVRKSGLRRCEFPLNFFLFGHVDNAGHEAEDAAHMIYVRHI